MFLSNMIMELVDFLEVHKLTSYVDHVAFALSEDHVSKVLE